MISDDDSGPVTSGLLTVESVVTGATRSLILEGELSVANAAAAESALQDMEATDATEIVIDLSGLDFMDSTGLRLVVGAHARSRLNGDRLRIVRGPGRVQDLFVVTGMADRLPFVEPC